MRSILGPLILGNSYINRVCFRAVEVFMLKPFKAARSSRQVLKFTKIFQRALIKEYVYTYLIHILD